MFTELHAMAKSAMLLMTATAEGDQLRVTISPAYPEGKAPAGVVALRALSLVGTPDELNADFAAALNVWQAPKRSIIEQAQAAADEPADDDAAEKPSAKVAAKVADAKPKGKGKGKAAAAPQADAATQQVADVDTADDASDVAAPAPTAEAAAPEAPVDVYTIDLF